jgi:hypothetical protein
MHLDDIAQMAFWTHHGHFEFLVMAFELTKVPSTLTLWPAILCTMHDTRHEGTQTTLHRLHASYNPSAAIKYFIKS